MEHHQHHRRNQRLNPNYEALVNLANNNVIHAMGGQFLIRQSKLLDIVLRLPPLFLMDQVSQKNRQTSISIIIVLTFHEFFKSWQNLVK